MAANKINERLAVIQLPMPTGVNISSGQPLLYGETAALPGVAVAAQNTANPNYDSNSGYLGVDFEGVYNLTVFAGTLGSVSAGAKFNPGDKVFASGGTYDPVTGITYGFTLCQDPNGTFFGRIMQSLAAGVTASVNVILRNAC